MADNMIKIVAKLNTDDSITQINSDLEKISKNPDLQNLEITGTLSPESIDRIRDQLSDIVIDVGGIHINDSNISAEVTNVVSKVQNVISGLTTSPKVDLQVNQEAVDQVLDSMDALRVYGVNTDKLSEKLSNLGITITKIQPKIASLGDRDNQFLQSFSLEGVDKDGNIVRYVETFNKKTKEFDNSTLTIVEDLGKIQKAELKLENDAERAQKIFNEFLKLQGEFDVYSKKFGDNTELQSKFETIANLISDFDNTAPLEKQREGIIKIDNALKLVKVDIDNIKNATPKSVNELYPPIAFNKGDSTSSILASAKDALNAEFKKTAETQSDTASRVKRAIEDTSGALQRFYVQVEKGDKSVETLTYALNEQGTAYEYVGKTIREADNSTDFRRKDIGTQWEIQSEKLKQFIANAERAGAASTILKDDIADLQKAVDNKTDDTNVLNAFLDDFDIAKAKLQAFNAEMRKENAIAAFNNRIKKLAADMNAYAVANNRAVESTKKMSSGKTFAEEWSRLMTQMAKGADLSDLELKQLIADLTVFKKESKAAGLEGASAFEKFGKAFKLISTYISANQLVNLAIRQIREAITELKEIDNILTEIHKTSDRTVESLKKLGETSFDVASKYGRTASDYLLGVQEMSRAGFSEVQSEQLAELSLRAQTAGDMTAEMANEYIIATNAAYKLEGNLDKLNQVLDSQNYITNHNAVNMENLAQATKIAASQAAASGVAVNELTAAVGTMVATTQQGGEQAGRAFKGILMNIQQVKASAADIGDGGDDITSESLSKYEKASAALGVALKEVKNGTLQLREPMEVLRDLSEAVRKESEDSIKVANLISAVGGKFRGNQLIALLKNWDTYEKMLSEYSSDSAINSAMDEAEKSANNWAGSINKVKNSWSELVSKFAESDNMIAILNSINEVIQSVSDSATTGALKVLSDVITSLANGIASLAKSFGTLPTAMAGVAAVMGLKGYGLFPKEGITSFSTSLDNLQTKFKAFNNIFSTRKLYSTRGIDLSVLSKDDISSLQKYVDLISKGEKQETAFALTMSNASDEAKRQSKGFDNLKASLDYGIISQKQYEAATKNITIAQKAATASSKALSIALNTIANIGISIVISKAIELINNFIHEEERAIEKEREMRQEVSATLDQREQDASQTQNLLNSYIELAATTSDLSTEKEKLLDIQDQLNESIDNQTEKIDLLNGSLSENIELIKQQRLAEAERIIAENQGYYDLILKGEQASSDAMQTYGDKDVDKAVSAIEAATGMHISGTLAEQSEQLEKMLEAYRNISGYSKVYYNNLVKGKKAIDDELAEWEKVKTAVETAKQTVQELKIVPETQKTFDNLIDQAKQFYDEMNGEGSTQQKFLASENLKKVKEQLYELTNGNDNLTEIVDTLFSSFDNGVSATLKSVNNLGEVWLATLDDMQKGSLKNISTMVSALQDLSEGKGIATNTFWSLVEFDEEGLLNGAKLIGDRYYIAQEKMIKLKDQYILKQIESIARDNEQNRINKEFYEGLVDQYEMESSMLTLQGKSVFSDEFKKVLKNLEDAKANAKEFGDQWERNNWLIEYLNQNLGNTVDLQKQLEAQQKQLNKELTALNKELDNYTKAYEAKIDGIVNGLEEELHELENQKEILEDELDVLEKQKDALDDTLDEYKKINSYVADILDKEIKNLEEQRDAIKDTYNERINALKAENDEREDALEYAQKLANLENAKNNKRRVYDEARGWRYESVKEDVVKAESDLKTFETNQEVKKLEKERDSEIEAWDALIKKKEDYKKQWTEWLDEIEHEEAEALLIEKYGAEARQQIADGDLTLLEKFSKDYREHNTELRRITDTEIKLKKESIDAKNKEVEAKKQQITAWKDYKDKLKTAVSEIKQANEEYMSQIGKIELTETSSLQRRDQEFEKFKNNVTNYIDQIGQKQSMIDNITEALDQISGGDYKLSFEVDGYDKLQSVESTLQSILDKMKGVHILSATEVALMMEEAGITNKDFGDATAKFIRYLKGEYSSGGVADYTGLAMLHGRKNAPELIFNANDSAKLYEMIHNTPNLMADMLTQANKLAGFKIANNESTNNSNVTFYIDKIVTDNPVDFENQLDRYYRTKLTQSYTMRQ